MDEQTFNMIYSDFVLLDSARDKLNSYVESLGLTVKEMYKRLLMIKELAKKRLKTTIIDEYNVSALIQETDDFYGNRRKTEKSSGKSFKDMLVEETVSVNQEMQKYEYIFNSSIIYVDSIKDFPNVNDTILGSYKFIDTHNNIFSYPIDKPKIFQNHFNLVKHFILQTTMFKTKFQSNQEALTITTLDALQGYTAECYVLGMLLFNEESKIQLQDKAKIILVDISETEWGKGFFTQGCVVIAQGCYKNEVFKAKVICHPPVLEKEFTFQEKFENDYFGAITKAFRNKDVEINNKQVVNLTNTSEKPEEKFLLNFLNKDITTMKWFYPKNIEGFVHNNIDSLSQSRNSNNINQRFFQSTAESISEEHFLVISNVDLLNQNVLNAMEKLISSYSASAPFMIVLMGNFIQESSFASFKNYSTGFENLINIIAKNLLIVKNTYVVLVPGPDDFSLFSGFPKHPIIENIVNPLKKKLPNLISASNPCRFSMFSKEIVFFRDNLNKKLSRNSIVKCNDISKNKDFYVHTVLCQGNLSPVDLSITSRIWHLAYTMSILPLPDFLILADVVEDFVISVSKTTVINPGSFSKDFSFSVIFPIKNLVEPSKINL